MGSNYTMKYDVDIVMCIDATASMKPFLEMVKNQAKNLYRDIQNRMQEKDKYIDDFRVRIIAFRDYIADLDNAMLVTDFYHLPDDVDVFNQLIDSIMWKGGGDDPEDGLEALGYAIKSKWNEQKGNKRRQIIVVWTDAGTHELGFGGDPRNIDLYAKNIDREGNLKVNGHKPEETEAWIRENYPSNMAKNFAELSQWWGCGQMPGFMDNDAKRLLIYAPSKAYWTTIAENWDNALLFESEAGKGLDKLSYDEILDAIAGSI